MNVKILHTAVTIDIAQIYEYINRVLLITTDSPWRERESGVGTVDMAQQGGSPVCRGAAQLCTYPYHSYGCSHSYVPRHVG